LGPGSATSDFTAEAKFGADFLLRLWDDPTRTFHYQVGIGSGNAKTVGDHDIWRLAQADDTFGGTDPRYRYIRNRPVFRSGAPGSLISPNLAGRDAAVFGMCFQVYKTTDPAFANRSGATPTRSCRPISARCSTGSSHERRPARRSRRRRRRSAARCSRPSRRDGTRSLTPTR
jgi:hypothetical protein